MMHWTGVGGRTSITSTITLLLLIITTLLHCNVVKAVELKDEVEGHPAEVTPLEDTPKDDEEYPIARVIRDICFPGQDGRCQTDNRGKSGGGGSACDCQPIIACASDMHRIQKTCVLLLGGNGVCCPQRTALRSGVSARLFQIPRPNVNVQPISNQRLNRACQQGKQAFEQTRRIEQELIRTNRVVPHETPARNHLSVFRTSRRARDVGNKADEVAQASSIMGAGFQLNRDQSAHGLRRFQVSDTILQSNCPQTPSCNRNSKYRTIEGHCNNLQNPLWGMASTPLQRILPPKYEDGIWNPRQRATNGNLLPNPRIITNHVLTDVDKPNQQFTLSVMQWAQFLDHDFAHVPFKSLENNEGIDCCPNNKLTANSVHRYCFPIPIDTRDAFYGPRGMTCMRFVRSMLALDESCQFGHAEQVNQLTHWIDGSNVYGSELHERNRLRLGQGGLLKVSGNNLLPIDPDSGGDCEAKSRGALCYIAGDSRVNEQPGLTAIHIIWHREHNRVARELQRFNPGWSDAQIYEEARRIIVAEMQHITYNEWLPIVVGNKLLRSFGISTLPTGYSFDYSSTQNPNMRNEFVTAAYRFGHTLVQGIIKLYSPTGAESTLKLRDHFNSPHLFQQQSGILDMFIRSLSNQAIQSYDSFITTDLSNHLFQTPNRNSGMDLMSLNIHRGRDHAIATYNEIRSICGLKKARTFEDLHDQMSADQVQRLRNIYNHVDDIDLFVGGISENPVSDGLLGWTFLCVVGDQFARLKKSDRFFYDLGGQPGSFTPNQLQEIRRTSWARVMCDNSDNVSLMQPLAFRLANAGINRAVSCSSPQIPRIDLSQWRGERPGV